MGASTEGWVLPPSGSLTFTLRDVPEDLSTASYPSLFLNRGKGRAFAEHGRGQ